MISVRIYRSSDYEHIKALYQKSATFGGLFDEDRDSAERINKQSETDPQSILIAEEDGKIIGTVSILQDKRFAWLIRFSVLNELASHALFHEASEILKRSGHTQVLVYAPVDEQKIADRYRKLNFNESNKAYQAYWRFLE